jgi:hypothetical protein
VASGKSCVVLYKKGWMGGILFGERFDHLQGCCISFGQAFFNTGNQKSGSWGQGNLYDSKPGLNLIVRGGALKLSLCGEDVHFCPWCGSTVEVKKSKDVILKQKTKEVPDGFDEIEKVATT